MYETHPLVFPVQIMYDCFYVMLQTSGLNMFIFKKEIELDI